MALDEHEKAGHSSKQTQIAYCPNCGGKVSSEMKFCPKCGAAQAAAVKPVTMRAGEKRATERPDIWGPISAGVILIILALAYIRNPIEPSLVINYLERMGKEGTYTKPPSSLLDAVVFFFYAAGAWGVMLSMLRVIFERDARKALGDLVGGLFSFFVASLLTRHASDVLTARETLAYFVMAIGMLVIVNVVIQLAFRKR